MRSLYSIVATLLLLALFPGLLYPLTPIHTSLPRINATRTLFIVAVTQLPNGTYAGTYARLTVHVVCPGSGHVYLETMPLTQIDTQASTRIAALVASMVAGIPFNYCNYYASIQANTTIVGGPSASLAMTVAFAAALMGLKLNHSVVMTGMIMPDGSVGPVGGLYYKLYAAKAAGAKVFLIPYGQINVTVTKVVKKRVGPAIIIKSYPVTINLAKVGSRIGVKVIQVATVFQALQYATNGAYRYSINAAVISRELKRLRERMAPVVSEWIESEKSSINSTLATVAELQTHLNSSTLLSHIVSKYVAEYVKMSRYYYSEGVGLEHKLPYAAASMLFVSLIYAKRALYTAKFFLNMKSINSSITELRKAITTYIDEVRREYRSAASIPMNKLSIYIDILERAYDALTSVNHAAKIARHLSSLSDLISVAGYVAYADARLFSAKLWSLALKNVSGGIEIPQRLLMRDAQTVEAYARNTVAYAIALASQVSSSLPPPVNSATKLLTLATLSRDPLTKLTLSIDALSNAYIALVTLFQIPALERTLNETTMILLSRLIELHTLPPDVAMYLELSHYEHPETLLLSRISIRLSSLLDLALQATHPQIHPAAVSSARTVTVVKTVTKTVTITVTHTVSRTKTVSHISTVTSTRTVTHTIRVVTSANVLPYIIAIAVILSCSVAAIVIVMHRHRVR